MRILIAVLVLIFGLQSWTKADDIRDFEIEGISIGDSALDFFSKELIDSKTRDFGYSNNEFIAVTGIDKNFKEYDVIGFYYKQNSSRKIIYSLDGVIWFKDSISKCERQKKKL